MTVKKVKKKKHRASKTKFEAWLDRKAKAKHAHFCKLYAGTVANIPGINDFRRAILVDLVRDKRAAALEKAGAKQRAALQEKFKGRNLLTGRLKHRRRIDRKGWGTVWDTYLSKLRRYYGADIVDYIRPAVASTGKKRVLFLGAGTGVAAAQLAGEMKELKVDGTSLTRLPEHRRYEAKNKNLRIRVCHFENMVRKLGKGKYALVFSHGSSSREENPEPVVGNVRQLLAKGGTALLDTQRKIQQKELEKWAEATLMKADVDDFLYILKK